MSYRTVAALSLVAIALATIRPAASQQVDRSGKPIRALLVLGGCCHDYGKQKDLLTRGITDTLRELSGLDVARIELNLASFGFHGEKRLFENLDMIGDLERTSRGSTLNGKVELRLPRQLSVQVSYLRKDYDDAAERDVKDVEVKLVLRVLLRHLLGR